MLFYQGFPWEEKKNKYALLPLHIMLKFKVFNIYLWEGNKGFKSSICWYVYNKMFGKICSYLAYYWSLYLKIKSALCTQLETGT
jgi:hypothetical protein